MDGHALLNSPQASTTSPFTTSIQTHLYRKPAPVLTQALSAPLRTCRIPPLLSTSRMAIVALSAPTAAPADEMVRAPPAWVVKAWSTVPRMMRSFGTRCALTKAPRSASDLASAAAIEAVGGRRSVKSAASEDGVSAVLG